MFHTNRLVIIGGPSASGKSTLMSMMQQGQLPNLCNQLCIDNYSSPLYIEAWKIPQVRQPYIEQLILHYDFLRQSLAEGEYAYLSDLINKSNSVAVLTICTSSDIFVQRISSRVKKVCISLFLKLRLRNTKRLFLLWKRKMLFRGASDLLALYDDWSNYIDKCGVTNHLIFDSSYANTTAKPYERTEVERMLNIQHIILDSQELNKETGRSLQA